MSDEPSGLSDRTDFESAIKVAEQLVRSGALWWKLAFHSTIIPRLNEQALNEVLGQKDDPRRVRFEQILRNEIVPALNRASGSPASSLPGFWLRPPGKSEQEEFEKRSTEIISRLYSESLRERVLVRRTSKGPTLEELRWDISIKKHDLAVGRIADVPYGTIEIVLAPEAGEATNPVSALANLIGPPRQVFAFDCHLGDLEGILRDLQDLLENLKTLSSTRGAQ